jgi:hypothetical protein
VERVETAKIQETKKRFRIIMMSSLLILSVEVGKNILEVTEEKRLRWFGHVKGMPGNRLPLKILEWEPEGTRREMDRLSKTEHDKPWTDRRGY